MMNKFIQNNKLIVPENELDNIYLWVKVSKTQEVLLDIEAYYKLMKHSFEIESKASISVLKEKFPGVSSTSYTLSDFITFTVNKSRILSGKICFVCASNTTLLNSLACYLSHTMSKYAPVEDSLASIIINKIDESEKFTMLMNAEFLVLNIYAPLPEHKYRDAILDTLLSRRCEPGLSTLIYTSNTGLLIADSLISKERANRYGLKDINTLVPIFEQRRQSSYKALMKTWFELLDPKDFVYSKEKPKETTRQAKRYND